MRGSAHNTSIHGFTPICPTLTPPDSKTHSTAGPSNILAPRSRETSSNEKPEIFGMRSVELSWEEQGISSQARDILREGWRKGTKAQYNPYIKKWENFCNNRNINPLIGSPAEVVNFLSEIFHNSGIGYSAMGTARSALSTFLSSDGRPIGEHPLVCRFLRGVFNLRPALPRYQVTWDVGAVFKILRKMHPPSSLSLKDLTCKLVTLLALLAGQRHQTLRLLDISNLSFTQEGMKIRITDLLKQSRPGHHLEELVFPSYEEDKSLCPVSYTIQYLKVTKLIRLKERRLFISYVKPYKAVTAVTISRWIKCILKRAKIDMSIFTPYSTRAAATSRAAEKVQIGTIIRTAGWSSEKTFARFYKKKILKKDSFARAVLETSK